MMASGPGRPRSVGSGPGGPTPVASGLTIAPGPCAGALAVSPAASLGASRLAVLYDRDCGLCLAIVSRLRRWDRGRRLDLVPLQEAGRMSRPSVVRIAGTLPLADRLHVVDEESGAVLAGGAAALAILDRLPGAAVFRPFARLGHVRWLVGRSYDLVAGHRHAISAKLGLAATCDVAPGRPGDPPSPAPGPSPARRVGEP
jgi:predicted DCC family thiol-disulfide oxidoreductase YuxK